MAGNVKVFLLIFFHHIVCISGQFSVLPNNSSVSEGMDAEFNCTTSSGVAVQWSIRRGSTQVVFIQGNQSGIAGLSEALILGPLGSPLSLVNVSRSLDGLAVVCTTLVGVVPQSQSEPFAFLSVSPLSGASCSSSQIQVKVNLEKTPIHLAPYISGNPNDITINCNVDGGSELPGGNIDLSDNTTQSLVWNRADFTIIDVNAGIVTVTCSVRNTQGECIPRLRLTVNYDAASCGAVSGCLATVLVVVLVIAIALAVGITVTVVVVVKKM